MEENKLTNELVVGQFEIPPTGVGGLLGSDLQITITKHPQNPTHGSGWMFQIQANAAVNRPDLKNPPTAVGGIQ